MSQLRDLSYILMGGIMIEKAYGKVNLTLEITGLKDGYHLLESIMVPINIYDTLTFELSDKDEVISNVYIKDNNVYKAVRLFKETFNIQQHIKITISKQIPIGSGLGGSSADISATLRGLNRFLNVNAPIEKLETLANKLGSDTLFCLYNTRAFVYGRGDKLKQYPSSKKLSFLLIIPNTQIMTKELFNVYDNEKAVHTYIGFEDYLIKDDITYIIRNGKNDLLNAALKHNEMFRGLYNELTSFNLDVKLSGSGPSLFIVSPTEAEIQIIERIKTKDFTTLLLNEI